MNLGASEAWKLSHHHRTRRHQRSPPRLRAPSLASHTSSPSGSPAALPQVACCTATIPFTDKLTACARGFTAATSATPAPTISAPWQAWSARRLHSPCSPQAANRVSHTSMAARTEVTAASTSTAL
ncbi:hypothetical protein [Acidovorax sp. Root267]|uniref:hypothetical protein n=1 Tax=Acidovorax sp. Root267 TaxID=1736505 RepID=UPI001F5B4754|nr:hypothetical protein [Acidovorax sp. Root267]